MIRLCKHNQESIPGKVRNGELDLVALSMTSLIDDIILEMNNTHMFDYLSDNILDLHAHNNTTIPYSLIWASAIAAKMKIQTSLTDVPYALSDHKTLAQLGYTLIDTDGNLKQGLMREGSLRFLLGKYNKELFIDGYNRTVQKGILPYLDIIPDIHILDCTDLEANYWNTNCEQSGISYSKRDERLRRGYKLATFRGIVDDTAVIKGIRFDSINTHDLTLSEEMLKTSPMLKEGDILINDRGFLSRDLINYLKTKRSIDIKKEYGNISASRFNCKRNG